MFMLVDAFEMAYGVLEVFDFIRCFNVLFKMFKSCCKVVYAF